MKRKARLARLLVHYRRMTRPRVAIAHDYLTQRGGAERVVLTMAAAFPDAPIYTTLYEPSSTFGEFADHDIRVGGLNRVGPLRRSHRYALPLLPFVINRMTIDADLVLASSSGWAHGVNATGKKLVYCYSPARWLYQADVYLGDHSGLKARLAAGVLSRTLRKWDARAAATADKYLAISTVVKDRIRAAYGFEAEVVPAPYSIDTSAPTEPVPRLEAGGYYLCVARLLPYKNVDKVIAAFANTDRRLVVVGRGPEEQRLTALATPNVTLLRDLSDAQLRYVYANCDGVIAASYEDFGLTPLEGGAYGKPSVVLRWGGFLDTMTEGVTCVYFDEPEPSKIAAAVTECDKIDWQPTAIRQHIEQFSTERFVQRLRDAVAELSG
jgi:glycosyltransferase involved in cell wall biosynthesis